MKNIIKKRKSIYKSIKAHLHSKNLLVVYLVLNLSVLGLSYVNPFLYKILVDNVMTEKKIDILIWILISYVIIFMTTMIISAFKLFIYNKFINNTLLNIRKFIIQVFIFFKAKEYETFNTGELTRILYDDSAVLGEFSINQIIDWFCDILQLVTTCVLLFVIDWRLAAAGLLLFPLSMFLTRFTGNKLQKGYEKQWEQESIQRDYAFSMLQNWREVKAQQILPEVSKQYCEYENQINDIIYKNNIIWTFHIMFLELKFNVIAKLSLYLLGGIMVISGDFSIGSLLMFITYYEVFNKVADSIVNRERDLLSTEVPINKVLSIVSVDIKNNKNLVPKCFKGEIKISNVCFAYNENLGYVLKNIHLNIVPNQRIALVGHSGGGKSTIVKLILGIYSPDVGVVEIDGEDITNLDSIYLYKKIGVVMQKPYLFNLSFRDNLLLSSEDNNEMNMWESLKKANLADFVKNLPNGLDTVIGERGVKLSGGQKQRLAIARALMNDPDILIFDEATSSLDLESEKLINEVVDGLAIKKTIIIVAHRLSSIIAADYCYVIDEGKIVEHGIPTHLIEQNGLFSTLYRDEYTQSKLINYKN